MKYLTMKMTVIIIVTIVMGIVILILMVLMMIMTILMIEGIHMYYKIKISLYIEGI